MSLRPIILLFATASRNLHRVCGAQLSTIYAPLLCVQSWAEAQNNGRTCSDQWCPATGFLHRAFRKAKVKEIEQSSETQQVREPKAEHQGPKAWQSNPAADRFPSSCKWCHSQTKGRCGWSAIKAQSQAKGWTGSPHAPTATASTPRAPVHWATSAEVVPRFCWDV